MRKCAKQREWLWKTKAEGLEELGDLRRIGKNHWFESWIHTGSSMLRKT